jgi:hypothetical protein
MGPSFPRPSESGRGSGSYEFRPSQSISSTIVDIALIAAVVYLAKIGVREPVVWSILSGVTVGRFGVAHSKTQERSSRGDGGGSGRSGGPPSGSSGSDRFSQTEERDPGTFPIPGVPNKPTPKPIPREEPDEPGGRPRGPVRRARLSARQRLSAWTARRRSLLESGLVMPWWARRAISVPLTPLVTLRVDVLSLATALVLLATLARVVAISPP